jgi:hypothetical protein
VYVSSPESAPSFQTSQCRSQNWIPWSFLYSLVSHGIFFSEQFWLMWPLKNLVQSFWIPL